MSAALMHHGAPDLKRALDDDFKLVNAAQTVRSAFLHERFDELPGLLIEQMSTTDSVRHEQYQKALSILLPALGIWWMKR
jgi:hypothetical protein